MSYLFELERKDSTISYHIKHEEVTLSELLDEFSRFLLAVGFQPDTIARHIDLNGFVEPDELNPMEDWFCDADPMNLRGYVEDAVQKMRNKGHADESIEEALFDVLFKNQE